MTSTRGISMRRFALHAAAVVAALTAVGVAATPADAGVSHSLIQGSGSSWSANAINQWIADVPPTGCRSSTHRTDRPRGARTSLTRQQISRSPRSAIRAWTRTTGAQDTSLGRSLRLPAGGRRGDVVPLPDPGRRPADPQPAAVRCDPAKIFTNQITNWDDPAITADNNGRKLPSLPIIPVVHSEGSGTSAQFTRYMDTLYPNIWRPLPGRSGLTEYYPRKGSMIAQSGSDGVMNFVSSKAANGAIGYRRVFLRAGQELPGDQAGERRGLLHPADAVQRRRRPDPGQDQHEQNDPSCPTGPANCYLLQNLDKVYNYSDPRTYPCRRTPTWSSRPRPRDPKMTTAKRQTLADFLYYSVCEGQKEMGPIGYSPLPINLVQASFSQINTLKEADPKVDLTERSVGHLPQPDVRRRTTDPQLPGRDRPQAAGL